MYIILRGVCHVRIKRQFENGEERDVVVTTLYDGQAFGELSLINYNRKNIYKSVLHKLVNEGKTLRITNIRKELN